MKQINALILVLAIALTSCNVSEQVSDQVIQKFLDIEQTTLADVETIQNKNAELIAGLGAPAKALKIQKETTETLAFIDEYRAHLLNACTSGDKPNYKDYECQVQYALGSKKNGKAYELEAELTAYVDHLTLIVGGEPFEKIARSASEIPEFKDNPKQREKDFATLNFGGRTTLAAAFAILADLKKEVVETENLALTTLSKNKVQ